MKTFQLFPCFPPDIRLLIWEEAAKIPTDDHIVVDFGAKLFAIREESYRPRLQARFYLRLGGNCKPLGTLGANVESREATLRMNPDFLQLNAGPKLYFNAIRNTIHFDFKSLYNIGLYFNQNLRNENLGWDNTHIEVRLDRRLRKHRIIRNLRGFCGIKNVSLPSSICDLSLAIMLLFFRAEGVPSAFGKVERVTSKSLPDTEDAVYVWERFMNSDIDNLFYRDADSIGCWVSRLKYDIVGHSRITWKTIITDDSTPWRVCPSWMMKEIRRIRGLFELPPT